MVWISWHGSAEETVCVSEISCTLRFLGRQMRSWGHGIYIYIYQLGNLLLGLLNLFFENLRAIRAIFLRPDPWSWNHVWMVVSGIPDFSMPIKMTWILVETWASLGTWTANSLCPCIFACNDPSVGYGGNRDNGDWAQATWLRPKVNGTLEMQLYYSNTFVVVYLAFTLFGWSCLQNMPWQPYYGNYADQERNEEVLTTGRHEETAWLESLQHGHNMTVQCLTPQLWPFSSYKYTPHL